MCFLIIFKPMRRILISYKSFDNTEHDYSIFIQRQDKLQDNFQTARNNALNFENDIYPR
jgi:putative heme iron utilization protein